MCFSSQKVEIHIYDIFFYVISILLIGEMIKNNNGKYLYVAEIIKIQKTGVSNNKLFAFYLLFP